MSKYVIEGTTIEGFINTEEKPIDSSELAKKFIEWLKGNNWTFDGMIKKSAKRK